MSKMHKYEPHEITEMVIIKEDESFEIKEECSDDNKHTEFIIDSNAIKLENEQT